MAKPSKDNFKERMKALAFYGTTKNNVSESTNQIATLVEYVRTEDGTAYGIVKENHNYYIKKSNNKGDLGTEDFAYIGGLENKNNNKYGSLSESQKNLNMVVKSINEAYSLGGVYTKLDESSQDDKTSDHQENNKVESTMDFLSNRIKDGKKNLSENKEKKFKASLQEKTNPSTNRKGLMSEEATLVIQKALGIVNEEAVSTKDSEQGESIDNKKDVEKGQSAALNQDGEDNQKDADKHLAKDKKGIEKADQNGSIAVDEGVEIKPTEKQSTFTEKPIKDSLITKDSNIDPAVLNKPKKSFGDANYGGEKVKSLADSEINADDSLANQDGKNKENVEAPINDENAKKKADESLKTPDAPSTKDSELNSNDSLANQVNKKKEKAQSPVNDTNAKSKADKKINEEQDISTADSEIQSADSLANNKSSKDDAQAPINDKNAKSEAEKRNGSGKSELPDDETSEVSGQISVDKAEINENEEGEPYKDNPKGEGDMSTDDSDHSDSDRLDNKDKHEKVDSHNSHYDVEMAHKEEKGEELKVKKEKNAIVAESEDISTADSEIESNVNEDDAGEDETEAAVAAMDDLEIAVDSEEEQESAPEEPHEEPDSPAEDVPPAPDVADDSEEDVDLDVNVDAADDSEEGNGDDEKDQKYREVKEKIADIKQITDEYDFEDDKIKDFVNSFLSDHEGEIAEMPIEDRKDIADEILKAKPDTDSIDSEVTGLEKGADSAIDNQINDLQQNNGADEPQNAEEPVQEDAEECESSSESESFQQYAESRGYSVDEMKDCSEGELCNLISGYANAYKNGENDGDHEGIAVYITPEIKSELADYGHSDFAEELEPYVNNVEEGVPETHAVEPMPRQEEINSDVDGDDSEEIELNSPDSPAEDVPPAPDVTDNGEEDVDLDVNVDAADDSEEGNMDQFYKMMYDELKGINDKTPEIIEKMKEYALKGGFQHVEPEQKSSIGDKLKGLVGLGETIDAGVLKPDGASIEYEDVNESEKKIRTYIRKRLSEVVEGKKSINENKKSRKLKALDKMIEEQLALFGKTIKK